MIKLIPILFLAISAFSQNNSNDAYRIKYNIFYNTEYPVTRQGALIVKKNLPESIFIIEPPSEKSNNEIEDSDNLKVTYLHKTSLFNYFNFVENQLLTKDVILSETYLINEKIPKMSWELFNEEKIIDNVTLKKAELNFRGRHFVAWYSLDYPIKIGPWKFHGLPGLIFEIYDSTNRYRWQIKSINQISLSKPDLSEAFGIKIDDCEEISIEQYVDFRYNQQLGSRVSSKLPRNIKVLSIKSMRPKRNGIEVQFEWEKEQGKN